MNGTLILGSQDCTILDIKDTIGEQNMALFGGNYDRRLELRSKMGNPHE